jgi:F0F1-type ATP synthase assembly protein I
MMTQPPENKASPARVDKKVIWMPLQAGCLTMLVAGVAILVGYLLDTRFGSFPRWTLIVLIASAPFTLGGVYWLVQRALKRGRKALEGEARLDEQNLSNDDSMHE